MIVDRISSKCRIVIDELGFEFADEHSFDALFVVEEEAVRVARGVPFVTTA